jgi:hypothetical protein
MNKSKKPLAILSAAAVAGLIVAAVSTPVSAKTTALVVNGKDGKTYEYNFDALKASAVQSALQNQTGAALYSDFMTRNNGMKAYYDDVKTAYVDATAVNSAAVTAKLAGQTFVLDTFTSAASTPTVAVTSDKMTSDATGIVYDNGVKVTPVNPTGQVTVSSVSAINARQIKVTFSGAVDSTSATTLANYTVNGVVGGTALVPGGAVLQADSKTVILTLDVPYRLTNTSTTNVVTVSGIKDVSSNAIATQTFTAIGYTSSTLPIANSVTVVDPTHVKVFFSEPVENAAQEVSAVAASTFITVDSGVVPVSGAVSPATATANPIENSVTFTLVSTLTAGSHTLHVNTGTLNGYNGLSVLPTDLTFNYAAVAGSPTATVVSATPNKIRIQFNRAVNQTGINASITAHDIYAGYASNYALSATPVDAGYNGYYTTYDFAFNPIIASTVGVTIANNTTTPIVDGFGNALTTQSINANVTVDSTQPIVSGTTFTNPQFAITFSKDMDNTSVTNPQNYTLVDASGNTVTSATTGFSGIVDGAGHPATVVFNHTTNLATVNFGGSVPTGTYSLKLTGLKDATVLNNALNTVSLPLSVTSNFKLSSAYANGATTATSVLLTFSHPISTSGTGSALLNSNYLIDISGNGSSLGALPTGTVLTASGTNGVTITFPSAVTFTTNVSKIYVQNNLTDSTGNLVSVAGLSTPIISNGTNTVDASNIRNIKLLNTSTVSFEVTKPLTGTLDNTKFTYATTQFTTASYTNQTLSDGTYGAVVYLTASSAPFNTYATNGQLSVAGTGAGTGAVTFAASANAFTPVNGTPSSGITSLYVNNIPTPSVVNVVADDVAPTITSVKTEDVDSNGKIDGIQVKFSEPVKISSLTGSTFTIDSGYAISGVTPITSGTDRDGTNVNTALTSGSVTATDTFILNVGEKLASDAGATPTVTLTSAVSDPSGNQMTAGSGIVATSGTSSQTALANSIAAVATAEAGKTEGTAIGNQVVGSAATLNTAMTAAQAVLANSASTPAQLTSAKTTLDAAIATYNAAIISSGNVTALNASIANVTTVETGKTEGVAVGNTIVGSKTTLDAAKVAAQTVATSAATETQAQLDAAKATLDAATAAYSNAVVANITSNLTAPTTLAVTGSVGGSITSTYVLGTGETLNVTSDSTKVVVTSATGLALTPGAAGTANVTVQVMKGGQVIKTGTVSVTTAS